MNLTKTRAALALAEKGYEALVAAQHDPNAFREEFISCIGLVGRVGSILDDETQGSRTHAFGAWWKKEKSDPAFLFLTDVRNAEFKRGEETKENDVVIAPQTVATVSSVGGDVAPKVTVVPATARATWRFAKTGDDPLVVLRRYLDRLRDEIVPTAERLTT